MSIERKTPEPAFLFDLDGTLIDSVYQHVVAWREALEHVGVSMAVWKIHRRIGMSGGLFVTALARELGHGLSDEAIAALPGPARRGLRPLLRGRAPAARRHRATEHPSRRRGLVRHRHERGGALRRPRPRAAVPARGHHLRHPRPRALRQARPRPVPHRRRAPGRGHRRRDRGGRQRLGPARRPPGGRAGHRASVRGLRARGAVLRRRLPGLRGSRPTCWPTSTRSGCAGRCRPA